MTVTTWIMLVAVTIALVTLIVALAAGWAALQAKLATMSTQITLIKDNHLRTLGKQIDELSAMVQEHLQEIVKLTVRQEAMTARMEKLEERRNSR